MRRIPVILVFLLSFAGCVEKPQVEESAIIYDEGQFQRFVQILTDNGVDFYKRGDNQVFYPVSEREKVRSAKEEIFGPVDPRLVGVSIRDEQRDAFVVALNSAGVSHQVLENDQGGFTITWESRDSNRTMSTINKIMSDNGW